MGNRRERARNILRRVDAVRQGVPITARPSSHPHVREEIAAVVVWLASDASSYMTGAIVPVDGGFTAV